MSEQWTHNSKQQIDKACDEIQHFNKTSPVLEKALLMFKTDFFQDSLKNEDQVKGVLLALGYIQTTLELRGQI